MYGSGVYGQETYGGGQGGGASAALPGTIAPPLVTAAFNVYAPGVHIEGEQSVDAPLVTNAMQVYPPASVEIRGRPLAEDIRIMRVRRQ